MTVLVAAASRHGSTDEIAAAIGRVLKERGVETEVAKIDDVESLEGYDAVVLGSAVYVGQWLEPARRFVDGHADELAERRTWLFSSGPVGDPPRPEAEEAVKLDEIIARTHATEHHLFAGKVDRTVLGFGERAVVTAVRAKQGDYRDWREIRSWAERIADALDDRNPA
jgi:menaquinone-dependent protoporphyrinogen oxidase